MANEHTAKVVGRNLPFSTKHAIEISKFIRGRSVKESKALLEKVLVKEVAVPFRRFNRDVGHKRGRIAAGRFPYKASRYFISLLNSLEANATNKGLDAESLYVKTVISNRASRPFKYGRFLRRRTKRTHVEMIAEELAEKPQKGRLPGRQEQKSANKEERAPEVKARP